MNKGKGQVVISAHVGCFGGGFLPSAVVSEVCSIVVQSAIETLLSADTDHHLIK
jgi:hypothetical protein